MRVCMCDSLPYLTIIDRKTSFESSFKPITDKQTQLNMNTLASQWNEWIPSFWERISLLLNASEAKNKGILYFTDYRQYSHTLPHLH